MSDDHRSGSGRDASDANERLSVEAKLANLQQLHQNILDSVAEGIFGIDLAGRVRFVNPAAVGILGWPEHDIVGGNKHDLLHHHYPDGRGYPAAACPILRTLRDGVARRVDEEVFFHRDGQAIAVEYVVSPVRGADGSVQGAVVCFRNISGRLADQAAMADSEERFRLAARASVNAIWDWDLDTNLVVWSGGLEALFGHTDNFLESQIDFWSERMHPDDQARVTESLKQAILGQQGQWEQEYRFLRPDGNYASVIDRGFVMRDATGKAVRMVGGMTDVSRMRTLEAQLRASQRLEAVGQLTGGVAHDFNNLLTVVLGNAELLQERLPPASLERELIDMVVDAAQRGASLTQRLLAFARRQTLDARPLCVGGLVRGMQHLIRRALGDHISLSIHIEPHDRVLADAG
ncbi:MAG: PAS domain S-box protein, partial [Thermomonas sp.]